MTSCNDIFNVENNSSTVAMSKTKKRYTCVVVTYRIKNTKANDLMCVITKLDSGTIHTISPIHKEALNYMKLQQIVQVQKLPLNQEM